MAKKKSTTKAIDEAMKIVSSYISELKRNLNEDNKPTSFIRRGPWISFSRGKDGGLELYGNEVQQYHNCLNSIVGTVNTDEVSKKAIEKYLKEAILAAIDMNNRRSERNPEQLIADAVSNLKERLTDKPTIKQVHYRVSGLKPTFNPSKFGRINFVIFDDEYFRSYKELITQNIIDETKRENVLNDILSFTENHLEGKTVAVIEVSAIDQEAARNQALKELQLTLDVINFYSDILYPSKHAYASVFGEEERRWKVSLYSFQVSTQNYYSIRKYLEDLKIFLCASWSTRKVLH